MERLSTIKNQLVNAKEPEIIFTYEKNFVEVLLNRPKSLNALAIGITYPLLEELKKWRKEKNIKVALFKGKGNVAFCAGGDIKALLLAIQNDQQSANSITTYFNSLFYQLATMDIYQISIWNGIVMGGGCGLSVHSKIRIATENAKFAMPETKIGLFTDVGAGYFLSRLRKGIGMYMALTGQMLFGEEIVQVGLANYFVKQEMLESLEKEIKETVIANDQVSIEELNKVVEKYATPIEKKFKLEDFTEKHFMKEDLFEIYHSLLKASEEDKDKMAGKILKEMQESCPKSLRVTFEILKRGKFKDLKDDLGMEIPAYQKIMRERDFNEGVRYRLIDKTTKPNWSHKSVFDVSNEEVNAYFDLPYVNIEDYIK